MGWRFMTASGTVYGGPGLLQSVIVSPEDTPGASAHVTLYNATAVNAAEEIMHLHAGSSGESKVWSLESGIAFKKLYASINSAHTTIVWG